MSEMNSFQDAFYIIAKELGFDYAQPLSPREVFEQQMLPRIRELVATQPADGEPVASSDELAAFEKWRHAQADSLSRCGYPDAAEKFIQLGSVHWAGWQARAALATQPEVPEQYEYWCIAFGRWRPIQELVEFLTSRGFKVRAVRGAEHD